MEILSALSSVTDIYRMYMPDNLRSSLLDLDTLSSIIPDLDTLSSISELSALFKDFISSNMDCKTLLLKIFERMISPLIKSLAWFFQFARQWLYTKVETAVNRLVDSFLSGAVNYMFPVERATTVTQFLRWIFQVGARILVDKGFDCVTTWVTGQLLQLVQVKPKIEESNIPEDTSQNTEVQVKPKIEESNIPEDTSQNTEVQVKPQQEESNIPDHTSLNTEVKVKEKKEEANNPEHMGHNMNMHREAFRGMKRKRTSEVTAEVTAMNPKRLCQQF